MPPTERVPLSGCTPRQNCLPLSPVFVSCDLSYFSTWCLPQSRKSPTSGGELFCVFVAARCLCLVYGRPHQRIPVAYVLLFCAQELGWTVFLMLVKGYIPKLSLGVSNQLLPLMQVLRKKTAPLRPAPLSCTVFQYSYQPCTTSRQRRWSWP